MADRNAFTPEEWNTLRDAPHLVALAVAMSGASGMVGTLKETFSSSAALVEAMKSDNELLRSIATREEISAAQKALRDSLPQMQGADFAAARQKVGATAVEKVRAAISIVAAKAPADVEAYRTFVQGLGERVANAAKEGGFLGFGGERVSEGERALLASLGTALSTTS
jgi:hypothetical protein